MNGVTLKSKGKAVRCDKITRPNYMLSSENIIWIQDTTRLKVEVGKMIQHANSDHMRVGGAVFISKAPQMILIYSQK